LYAALRYGEPLPADFHEAQLLRRMKVRPTYTEAVGVMPVQLVADLVTLEYIEARVRAEASGGGSALSQEDDEEDGDEILRSLGVEY